MQTKARYTQEPEPVTTQEHRGYINVTVAVNPVKIADDPEQWEADTNSFWELKENIDLEAVIAAPENYLDYVTVSEKSSARQRAQDMLDKIRENPIVPVPSYREGAAVNNRPGDQNKLLFGLLKGGLPYFELHGMKPVALSGDDIKAIAYDLEQWETNVQKAKQACWDDIDAATSWQEITSALADFEQYLNSSVVK